MMNLDTGWGKGVVAITPQKITAYTMVFMSTPMLLSNTASSSIASAVCTALLCSARTEEKDYGPTLSKKK
jgi:hypothetical protein